MVIRCTLALFFASLAPAQTPLAGEIGAGETRSYAVIMKAGDQLLVHLQGSGLTSRLIGPNSAKVLETRRADWRWIADAAGAYQLQVSPTDPNSKSSRFQIRLEDPRPATQQDRIHYAIQGFEDEAAAQRAKGNYEQEALALRRIALLYERLSQYDRAIEYHQQALDLCRRIHFRQGEAGSLNSIGDVYASLAQCHRALGFYQQGLEIRREIHDKSGEASSLNNIGTCQLQSGQVRQAIRQFEQALALAGEAGGKSLQGSTLNNLGAGYSLLSQYEKAREYYQKALELARQTKERDDEATALSNLGLVYRKLGQYATAIQYYEEALPILQQEHDLRGEATNLQKLGAAYHALSQFEKAIRYYERALALQQQTKDARGEAYTLNNLGATYHALGDFENAVQYFDRALALHRRNGDKQGEAECTSNLGAAYDATGDYAKASAFYREGLLLYRRLQDLQGEAVCLHNLGRIAGLQKKYAESIRTLEQALVMKRQIADHGTEGETLNQLGVSYRETGQFEKGVGLHQQALEIAREVGDLRGERSALHQLAVAWSGAKRTRLATFYGKQAVNTLQQIRSQLRGLSQQLQESYAKDNEATYRLLADLLIAQGRLPEAQQVLTLLKGEEYYAFVRRDAARTSGLDGRADLLPDEAEWARRYAEIGDKLVGFGARRSELLAKKPRTPEDDAELGRLEQDLRVGNQAFRQVLARLTAQLSAKPEAVPITALPLKDIAAFSSDLATLKHGAVAIYTLAGEDKLRTILVTSQVRRAYEYPIGAASLNRKIAQFREAVQNPAVDPIPLARELYGILFVPALAEDLRQAKAETLMFSLDGALRYLPLPALHDGQHFLIENYRLAVFTAASTARLKEEPRQDWNLIGFGVTQKVGDFSPLPNVAGELNGIVHGIVPGEALLDQAFTEASMTSALRRGFSVVHIATHFSFQPGDETKSFLLLGDGKHLSLADLDNMAAPFQDVDLLSLSGCNTGIGDGREVEGLGVIAQRQGAKAVIATLWPVADASTSELMQEFYRLRQATPGLLKSEALRQAQVEMLTGKLGATANASDNRGVAVSRPVKPPQSYRHPYYWAPFFLMGNWL